MALPDGVVTFLFTDVEGSTRLWEESPESMMAALLEHDAPIEHAADTHRGASVRPRGEWNSRFAVFGNAADAVAAAAEMQLAAANRTGPPPGRCWYEWRSTLVLRLYSGPSGCATGVQHAMRRSSI